jgi:hypothetical protein
LIAFDQEQVAVDVQAGFVGRRRGKVAERHQRIDIDRDAQLLVQLPDQRALRGFARIDLSAGLHETRGAALSDQKRVAILANEERGGYPQAWFISVFVHLDFDGWREWRGVGPPKESRAVFKANLAAKSSSRRRN